jgi:bacillithiol biosynthesis cysteine-adding enzyme BshC
MPDCLAVVTGQQPGLLGGPLYTFTKILSAIIFAKQLQERWNIPVAPILWDGGDDHDLAEVNHLAWPTADGEIAEFRFDLDQAGSRPAWKLPLDRGMNQALLDFIAGVHPPTEFRQAAVDLINQTWAGCPLWTDFFDRFWLKVFEKHPLLVIRPWEKALRRMAFPVLEKEITEPGAARKELTDLSKQLGESGYKPNIHKREGVCSFFLIEGTKRISVEWGEGMFRTEEGKEYSMEEFLHECRANPEWVSPNALLRPVVQDAILPTAAVVLGPSEISYHAQIGGLYRRHGIPRPWILPRFSLTLASGSQEKRVAELGLSWTDLRRDEGEIQKRLATSEFLDESLPLLEDLRARTAGAKRVLGELAGGKRQGLKESIESQLGRVAKAVDQIEDLLRREEARAGGSAQQRVRTLRNHLFPTGEMQERVFGLAPFLCRFGFDWIEGLVQHAMGWSGQEHRICIIEPEREE